MLKKPFKIGITGGIACGKSLVRKILENNDIPVIDADDVVHDILKSDAGAIKNICDIFGTDILDSEGGISRKKLATIVFNDNSKLKQLESIVHPTTYHYISTFINNEDNDIVAAVIPLLFETNRQHLFDIVWLITSEEEEQIARLKLRDDMADHEAQQRIAAQMPQSLKMSLADTIIENNSTVENLKNQVEKELATIKNSL